MSTSVFFIGATGYIGGGALATILELPNAKNLSINALVRSPEKAKILAEKFPVKAVVGSTDDHELISKLASDAHIVISTADADDLPAIQAILRGMKERHTKTGDTPILIHTSGTGVLSTDDRGLKVGPNIYDDSKPESIASLPLTQVHRNIDLAIVDADQNGDLKSYIILPSTIYGVASHSLVKAGFSNPHSQQIPDLIKVGLARGEVGVFGKGLAIWGNVHTEDVSDLYALILEKALEGNAALGHGVDGFYFGIAGEHTWYDISKEIARVLVEMGRVKNTEPTPFAEDELLKYFGTLANAYVFGTTSRGVANHSKTIGWQPKFDSKDMITSIKTEIEVIINSGLPWKAKGVN